jgi:hypothetical protein
MKSLFQDKQMPGRTDLNRHMNEQMILLDSLWVLARCFNGLKGPAGVNEFLKAYIYGGTVVNSRDIWRTVEEDVYIGFLVRTNLASAPSAAIPPNYIFAVDFQFSVV